MKAAWSPGDDTLLRQTGVIRVPTLPDLLDTARLLTRQPLPGGRRVAVVGNAGGSLAIAADAVLAAGLELAELAGPTRVALAALTDRPVPDTDLIDLGLRAHGDTFAHAARPPGVRPWGRQRDPGVRPVARGHRGGGARRPRLGLRRPSRRRRGCLLLRRGAGRDPDDDKPSVPVYDAVDRAAGALGRVAQYAGWLQERPGVPLQLSDDAIARAARS